MKPDSHSSVSARAVRAIAASCTLLALCALTTTARAEELARRGNFAFAAERMFGFYLDKQSINNGNITVDYDTTDFSLGWDNSRVNLMMPRLGIDYLLTDNVSLGGSFGVYSRNVDRTGMAGGVGGTSSSDDTAIMLALRAGYLLRLSHAVTFWPRGGFTYYTVNGGNGLAPDEKLFALTLEGMFSLAPSENWAVLIGPTIDIGFTGRQQGNDLTERSFGIMAGLVVWFGA